MRIKAGKFTISEFFVISSYCIYISCEILNYTQFRNILGWNFVHRMIVCLSAFLVVVGILTKKKQKMKWLILSVMIIATGLVIVIYNDQLTNTAVLVLFILAGSCIHDEKIFRCHWIIVVLLVSFTILLYVIGIYKPDYIVRTTIAGQTDRAYLGFAYTTYPPNYLIHLMFTYYASSRKKQIQAIDTIVFLIINYIFYKLTATFAVFYEVFLFLLALWLLKIREEMFASKLFGIVSTIFMPLMALLSLLFSIIYTPTNAALFMINRVLSNRLSLAHTGIIRYGLKLFGNPVEWAGGRYGIERFEEYFYVDSSYVNIALTYGMITLLFIVLCFALLNYKAYKKGNYKLCIVFMILALHSSTDPQLLELKYNPFLIIILAAFIPSMEQVLMIGTNNAGHNIDIITKTKKKWIRLMKGLRNV